MLCQRSNVFLRNFYVSEDYRRDGTHLMYYGKITGREVGSFRNILDRRRDEVGIIKGH